MQAVFKICQFIDLLLHWWNIDFFAPYKVPVVVYCKFVLIRKKSIGKLKTGTQKLMDVSVICRLLVHHSYTVIFLPTKRDYFRYLERSLCTNRTSKQATIDAWVLFFPSTYVFTCVVFPCIQFKASVINYYKNKHWKNYLVCYCRKRIDYMKWNKIMALVTYYCAN